MKTAVNLSSKSSRCYVIAERWASDLEFFTIESIFFQHLLKKYAISFSTSADLENLKKHGRELRTLDEERQKIEILVHEQLELIALVAEDVVPENLEKIETTQTTLESLMIEVTKRYRELKKKLFTTVENIEQNFE